MEDGVGKVQGVINKIQSSTFIASTYNGRLLPRREAPVDDEELSAEGPWRNLPERLHAVDDVAAAFVADSL